MFENAINGKKQGDIGMCYAIACFSKMGYTVNIPITDSNGSTALMVEGHRSVKPAHKKLSKFDSYYSHFYKQSQFSDMPSVKGISSLQEQYKSALIKMANGNLAKVVYAGD